MRVVGKALAVGKVKRARKAQAKSKILAATKAEAASKARGASKAQAASKAQGVARLQLAAREAQGMSKALTATAPRRNELTLRRDEPTQTRRATPGEI